VNRLRLERHDDCLVIDARFWEDLVDWAEDNGWKPELPSVLYRSDSGVTVSDSDAANLAEALELIAGDLVLYDLDVPDHFLKDLVRTLMVLTEFLQRGAFRIT